MEAPGTAFILSEKNRSVSLYTPFSISPAITVARAETRYHDETSVPGRESADMSDGRRSEDCRLHSGMTDLSRGNKVRDWGTAYTATRPTKMAYILKSCMIAGKSRMRVVSEERMTPKIAAVLAVNLWVWLSSDRRWLRTVDFLRCQKEMHDLLVRYAGAPVARKIQTFYEKITVYG